MTFTPPTKRTTGQCTCPPEKRRDADHSPDCPALYPLQPQPGDEPDTLTRLTRHIRERMGQSSCLWEDAALSLVSEASEERATMAGRLSDSISEADRLRSERNELQRRLAAAEEVVTRLSNKATEFNRLGQTNGRLELAEEIASMLTTMPEQVPGFLRRIIDGEQ